MSVTYLEFIETDLKKRLESLKEKLTRNNYDTLVFDVTKNTFQNIVYDFKRYFYEKLFIYEYSPIRYNSEDKVNISYDSFISNLVSDYIDKARKVSDFKEVLSSVEQMLGIMSSIFNDRKYVYYGDSLRYNIGCETSSTSLINWEGWMNTIKLDEVASCISANNSKNKYRLFDASVPHKKYCLEVNDNIAIASKDWQLPLDFYGVSKAEGLKSNEYKRIIIGNVQEIKVAAKSFDIVHSFLPITNEIESSCFVNVLGHDNFANVKEILRLRFLSTILRPDGILIVHLPLYALSSDLCHELSKRFTNFSVFHKENYLRSKTIITLVAKRRSNNETDGESVKNDYDTLRNILFETTYDSEKQELLIPIFKQDYVLSPNTNTSKNFVFRGHHLSQDELVSFTTKSNLYNQFYNSKETYFDRYEGKHPLLPFTNGQLGLVLVSGFLDGIVQEDDEHCHVVKGRSSKHIASDIDFGEKTVVLHNNYSNKIEINMFEPDGTYKTLI